MSSEPWRSEAFGRFPAFAEDIHAHETPYELWNGLWIAFECAYSSGDMKLVADIYAFAAWCGSGQRETSAIDDLPTCVNVCFTERIPTNSLALDDMPRWLTLEDVKRLKATLSHRVGDEGYKRVLRRYAA